MAAGNIEDWLTALETEMQRSVRRECKIACADCGNIYNGCSVKDFCDKYVAQVSLLGVQVVWTVDFQDALVKMSKEKDKVRRGRGWRRTIKETHRAFSLS